MTEELCLSAGGKTQGQTTHQAATNAPPVVLNVSSDLSLLITRALILEHAGFVVRACSPERALPRLSEGDIRFDAVVLCHSIELDERVVLAERIRAGAPNLALVVMHLPGDHFDSSACDAVLMAQAGPEALVRAVRRALRRRAPTP
jgi:hypothetical protein